MIGCVGVPINPIFDITFLYLFLVITTGLYPSLVNTKSPFFIFSIGICPLFVRINVPFTKQSS